MIDYYKTLGVKRTASNADIKSAYRKLARLRHPDVNHDSETAAHEFDLLSKAYHTLSDPQERALLRHQLNSETAGLHLYSDNPQHAAPKPGGKG